jgi:hypothetical protein
MPWPKRHLFPLVIRHCTTRVAIVAGAVEFRGVQCLQAKNTQKIWPKIELRTRSSHIQTPLDPMTVRDTVTNRILSQ